VSRRLALLVNPAAGGGRARALGPDVRSELERLGAAPRVVETRSLEHAIGEARTASAAGEVVVGLGGDGLIGRLAGALRDADTPLAVIPAGRGNDFARALGIPLEPRAAARVAVHGSERLVDVAEANGTPFVGIASLGFDSDVQAVANSARLVRGQLVYLYATLRALAGWRHAGFEVEVDGDHQTVTGYSVAVANSGRFGGGMLLVPHASLDDGILDVYTSARASKLRFLINLPKVFKGTHVDAPSIAFTTGRTVEVRADRPFTVYADGDPVAELPLTVRIRQRALRVLVPG